MIPNLLCFAQGAIFRSVHSTLNKYSQLPIFLSVLHMSAPLTNMDILLYRLGDLFPIEFKSNLIVSNVWNTGETGDIYSPRFHIKQSMLKNGI